MDGRGVRDDLDTARAASIATADARRSVAELGERLDRHLNGRSLSRSPDGQVPDGHDAARQRARLQDSVAVQPLACAEQASVAAAGDGEQPRGTGRKPLFPSADEALAGVHPPTPGWR